MIYNSEKANKLVSDRISFLEEALKDAINILLPIIDYCTNKDGSKIESTNWDYVEGGAEYTLHNAWDDFQKKYYGKIDRVPKYNPEYDNRTYRDDGDDL